MWREGTLVLLIGRHTHLSCVWGWGHSVGMNKDGGHTGMTREEGGHTCGLSGQGLGDTLGG